MRFNFRKRFFPLPLALAALLLLPAAAGAADADVVFTGGAVEFGSKSAYTDSDLFGSFKNVMPGDTRTEEIVLKNEAGDPAKVFMRALLHTEDTGENPVSPKVKAELDADARRGDTAATEYMRDFLGQLSLKVWNGDALIYEGSPDKLDGLEERVELGTIPQGGTVALKAELTVPLELDNKYMGRIGEVDWEWEFQAEVPLFPGGGGGNPNPPAKPGVGPPKPPPWDGMVHSSKGPPPWDGTVHLETLPPAELLRTGLLNWPVPVLGGLGIALLGAGLFIIARKRKDEDAEEI